MGYRVFTLSALVALAAGTGSAQAPAAPKLDGEALARAVETGPDAGREAQVARAGTLSLGEQARFVGWAEARWKGEGWLHLAPALARVGTLGAARHLSVVALADPGAPAGRAALAALGELSAEHAFELVWEGWRGGRSLRRAFTPPLQRLLSEQGLQALPRLALAMEAVVEEEREAVDEAVSGVVAAALAESPRPGELLAAVVPGGTAAAIARGLARGVALRIPTRAALERTLRDQAVQARLDDPLRSPEEELRPEDLELEAPGYSLVQEEERAAFERLLFELAHRSEPLVRVDVLESLPLVLDEVSDEWAAVLLDALELRLVPPSSADEGPPITDDGQAIRDGAFRALRTISGQALTQTRAAWSGWLEAERGKRARN